MARVQIPVRLDSPGIAEVDTLYSDNANMQQGTLFDRGFATVTLRFWNDQEFTLKTYVRPYLTSAEILYDSVLVAAWSSTNKNIFTFNLADLQNVRFETVGGAVAQSDWSVVMEATQNECCGGSC